VQADIEGLHLFEDLEVGFAESPTSGYEPEKTGQQPEVLSVEDLLEACREEGETVSGPKIGLMSSTDACHIIYTSGSSGEPKGVVCQHSALFSYCRAKPKAHDIMAGSRVLLCSASTWDPAIGDICSTLVSGAVLCLASRGMVVQDLAGAIQRSKATHILATPALWNLLDPACKPEHFPCLKVVALGGEQFPESILTHWRGRKESYTENEPRDEEIQFVNTYGVTEAAVYQTRANMNVLHDLHAQGRMKGVKSISGIAGAPLEGVKIMLHSSEERTHGNMEIDEGVGEIFVGGQQVCRGYLSQASLTAERFVQIAGESWFKTGDLGRWVTVEGLGAQLQILGRVDTQVKIRGFRVELDEIEAILQQSPLVLRAVAVKATNPERIVAYIQPPPAAKISCLGLEGPGSAALSCFCRRFMPVYQVPNQYVPVTEWPLTSSGKVLRSALPEPPKHSKKKIRQQFHLSVPPGAKKNQGDEDLSEVESAISRAWAEALGMDAACLGPYDEWTDLGGTSVAAVRMLECLDRELSLVRSRDSATRATVEESELKAQSESQVFQKKRFEDQLRVRLCGLLRRPQLRQFADFIEWMSRNAQERSSSGDEQGKISDTTPDDILRRLDAGEDGFCGGLANPEGQPVPRAAIVALGTAAEMGEEAIVKELLRLGVIPDGLSTKLNNIQSPCMRAENAGHFKVAELLRNRTHEGHGGNTQQTR